MHSQADFPNEMSDMHPDQLVHEHPSNPEFEFCVEVNNSNSRFHPFVDFVCEFYELPLSSDLRFVIS